MKAQLQLLGICLTFSLYSHAQVAIGAPTANTSAALDITSTSGGLLIPRLNTTQIGTIIGPTEGLLIYNTDYKEFWGYVSAGAANVISQPAGFSSAVVNSTNDLGQSFLAPYDIKLADIGVMINIPTPGNITMNVYYGTGTFGGLLATSTQSISNNTSQLIYFNFSSANLSLAANNTYTFILTNASPSNNLVVKYSLSNVYTGGSAIQNGTVDPGSDLVFYVRRSSIAGWKPLNH